MVSQRLIESLRSKAMAVMVAAVGCGCHGTIETTCRTRGGVENVVAVLHEDLLEGVRTLQELVPSERIAQLLAEPDAFLASVGGSGVDALARILRVPLVFQELWRSSDGAGHGDRVILLYPENRVACRAANEAQVRRESA